MNENPPVCACSNGGKPYLLNGVMVIARDPSCRIHRIESKAAIIPVSAESIAGNWNGREKEK